MCATCGCAGAVHAEHPHPEHPPLHDHGDGLPHLHPEPEPRLLRLERDVLERNDAAAARVRRHLEAAGVLALNLVSSPGSGKTSLLERTVRALRDEFPVCVIEGDQETSRDAARILAAGAPALQINTGAACHLDAGSIERAVHALRPPPGALLFIENVGNLVCPALFDLGERAKVVVASVTEGDDKPLKYPHMFRACELVVLNKVDLLAHVPFSAEHFAQNLDAVNSAAELLQVSALTGQGLDAWYRWLRQQALPAQAEAAP